MLPALALLAALSPVSAQQRREARDLWSFQPIRAQTVADRAASSTRLDELVAREWPGHGLQPAPEADRVMLLRRLSFDLTGLPPDPAQAAAFLADAAPDAVERLVDRLLASPHYGERMATFWLDLVRYADTVGYHGDQPMRVWPYRDYVIAAFQANMPFDRFTREQLAGDLLPEATLQQRVASGYNRLGMMSAEGGVQDREYLAKYIAERVRNAAGTWLGITLGCAECHDHKFDPLTSLDFYRFEAFFADLEERGLYSGANDSGNWGPFVQVPTPEQEALRVRLRAELADVQRELDADTPALAAAQAAWEAALPHWTPLTPTTVQTRNGTTLQPRADGALLASGARPDTEVCTLVVPVVARGATALRLDVLPDDSLPAHGPGRAGNGNFVLTEVRAVLRAADGKEQPLPFAHANASFEQQGAVGENPYGRWPAAAAIDGDAKGNTWGWAVMEQAGRAHAAVFTFAQPLELPVGAALVLSLAQEHGHGSHTLGCFRLASTTDAAPQTVDAPWSSELTAALALAPAQRSEAQRAQVAAHYRSLAPALQGQRDHKLELERRLQQLEREIPTTLVARAVAPRTVRVLRRGNWMDDRGEIVTPGFPAALAGSAPTAAEQPRRTRQDLARWLTGPDNPLTARAFANRVWQLFFGQGLARRPEDLGAQGEAPTHPELLDHLAADFRDHGWDVQRLVKTIVLSRTYRRSSQATAAQRDRDPDNRWLARQNAFRLDAEFVRDNALSISGLLDRTVGGPSVFPYQPKGYWAYLNFPTREWQDSQGAALWRRGLYTHWQRQFLHPSLLAFDAPSREECTAQRARSNTPLQPLVLLNDPTHVEAARALAEQVLEHGGDGDAARLAYAFARALQRQPHRAEAALLLELLAEQRREFAADPVAAAALLAVGARPPAPGLAAPEVAAWTGVTRAILNLHETTTRP